MKYAVVLFLLCAYYYPANGEEQLDVTKMLHGKGMDADLYRAGVDDVEGAREWYSRLKSTIVSGNRSRLMAMIQFPVTVATDTARKEIKTPDDFLSQYDEIITPKLKSIVSCTTFEQLRANYRGIMIGSGVVIFENFVAEDVHDTTALKVRFFYNGSLMENDLQKCTRSSQGN